MTFDGKVAVVTGAASGIGRAVARLLASRGARVAALDVATDDPHTSQDDLDSLRDVRAVRVDVTQAAAVDRVVDDIHAAWGRLDVLVVSAGIQRYGTALSTPDDEWARVLDVNLSGAWHAARACLRHMTSGAAIVTVASIQGLASQRNVCAYTASKHGLIGLTRSIAIDFAQAGIRANVVCPGTVDTPMWRWAASLDPDPQSVIEACQAMHPLGRIARPEEIAEVVAFLAHERASFMTGAVVPVDGGLLTQIDGSPRTEAPR